MAPLGNKRNPKYEPGEAVRGNKFWNTKKGKGLVLERLDRTKVVVEWENGEATPEWELDLEPLEEND